MSRAFVKDDDDRPEPEIERPVSDAPNYVTKRGLERLKAALAEAKGMGAERDIRYYEERLASAIVVGPPADPRVVAFGATIRARDPNGTPITVRIVGEDEADPLHGSVSLQSPIAQAFLDRRAGDRAVVIRPAGPIEYTIDTVSYEE